MSLDAITRNALYRIAHGLKRELAYHRNNSPKIQIPLLRALREIEDVLNGEEKTTGSHKTAGNSTGEDKTWLATGVGRQCACAQEGAE